MHDLVSSLQMKSINVLIKKFALVETEKYITSLKICMETELKSACNQLETKKLGRIPNFRNSSEM